MHIACDSIAYHIEYRLPFRAWLIFLIHGICFFFFFFFFTSAIFSSYIHTKIDNINIFFLSKLCICTYVSCSHIFTRIHVQKIVLSRAITSDRNNRYTIFIENIRMFFFSQAIPQRTSMIRIGSRAVHIFKSTHNR